MKSAAVKNIEDFINVLQTFYLFRISQKSRRMY